MKTIPKRGKADGSVRNSARPIGLGDGLRIGLHMVSGGGFRE
ncbi:unnamed protein product [Tuwongella immobilis]|uniref:Uncharacterized protein n=1 Tax=Tuwongella immobilis TaxID=692036 RepID=A0A6C2YGI3_9BACT|nr:unnamed protein product [Tuwongella immobilis]VTR96678.1 unnamed protein product [Tuwongella immobilis]